VERAKEAAGRRAADLVESGTVLGLGTGSTVWFALLRLAERVRHVGLVVRGVPTSLDTVR
jgi:ribose 5-phosphate isomerase A